MYKEIDFQVKAVKELVEKTKKLLLLNGNRKTIVFEAPTGSGKTVTATKTLCELSTELENEGKEVAFIW
ncbi:MAG: DEAD/DEAH box helicase family protein, partial [Bacteroidales bacterium]|nr:DEAD/DEAH box helicase family protein [Bacteroidales bacterium]